VLRILEESNKKARAIFLVSAWQGLLNSEEFDPLIKTFFDTPFNFEKIRANVEAIYQYHGDNDPYVPLGMAKELSINLKSKLSVIKAGGHLNEAAGFVEFPLLRDDLFAVLRK
jgi:predicted alpha/beta hydrolase family esterase